MASEIHLSPEAIAILEHAVERGEFATIDAAAEHAVLQLDVIPWSDELEELIRPALDELDRGEGIPYTPDLIKQAFAKARDQFERRAIERSSA